MISNINEVIFSCDDQPIILDNSKNITFSPMVIVLKPTKVIFNDPATIVFWNDGSKTVVKCSEDDVFDTYRGFTMAYLKKTMGSGRKAEKFVDDNEFEEANRSLFEDIMSLLDTLENYLRL